MRGTTSRNAAVQPARVRTRARRRCTELDRFALGCWCRSDCRAWARQQRRRGDPRRRSLGACATLKMRTYVRTCATPREVGRATHPAPHRRPHPPRRPVPRPLPGGSTAWSPAAPASTTPCRLWSSWPCASWSTCDPPIPHTRSSCRSRCHLSPRSRTDDQHDLRRLRASGTQPGGERLPAARQPGRSCGGLSFTSRRICWPATATTTASSRPRPAYR